MRMPEEEARRRLAEARVARLATAGADGVPHLVPVTFAVDGDDIVFAVDHKPKSTTNLRRLRNIEANPAVSFLADRFEEDWDALWWARADATARVVTADAERSGPIAALAAKYEQYRQRPPEGPAVVSRVTRWSGWRAS